jgi:glycosyltransferase involved in cell wall biosynthesis
MDKIKSTLIISTYNWPEALMCCFKSVAYQSTLPDEVIIADDGSTEETGKLIEGIKNMLPIPVIHVWQPDEGFQLARIRNKAIAKATHEYIIQIDGDIILHPNFIHDHLALAKAGTFVTGSRTILGPETSKKVLASQQINFTLFIRNSKNFFNGVRIPLMRDLMASRYKIKGKNKFYVKGCNMAFWREDLVKVNGYNEAFTGWGREDSELAIRLINSNLEKRFIKMGGICFHLYHKEASRELEQKNIQMMKDAITHKITRAEIGLDQYLSVKF